MIAALQWDKASTKSLAKYTDYGNVFSSNPAMEFLKNPSINKYTIELVEVKQSPYKTIHPLSPVKLKILKTYIKTYLKTRFIQTSKSYVSAPILFDSMLIMEASRIS